MKGDFSDFIAPADTPVLGISPPAIFGVAIDGSNIVLTWSSDAGGFVLETASSLSAPNEWLSVDAEPVLENGINRVTLPADQQMQFFQLLKP